MEHLKAYILALKNMNTDFTIRIAQQSDALELMSLFQETVLHINKRDYSEAEVADWASCGNDLSHIKDMIKTHYFIVATNQQSQIVGFSSITHQGYLHSMFIHKDFQCIFCRCIRLQSPATQVSHLLPARRKSSVMTIRGRRYAVCKSEVSIR
jgi:hypothetical protein